MTTISREIEIRVSKEKAWAMLAKFGDICHANPGIVKSYVTSEQKEGVGATRHCDLAMMSATVDEKITEWREGEAMTIEAFRFHKLPGMKSMTGAFSVRSSGANAIVKATLTYSMKNLFFDIADSMMMKRMNTRVWNTQMAGLKKYMETGVRVKPDTPLELDKVVSVD